MLFLPGCHSGRPCAKRRERPCSQGQAVLFGKGPQEISPALRARAARSLRGRFVVEGAGKAEPRSSRRAQAKHRAGDREIAGKNWRNGSTENLLRQMDGIEDALRKQRSGAPPPHCTEWRQSIQAIRTDSDGSEIRAVMTQRLPETQLHCPGGLRWVKCKIRN